MHLSVTTEGRETLCKDIIKNNATQSKDSQLRANEQISERKHWNR